jgi:hypothetical protein
VQSDPIRGRSAARDVVLTRGNVEAALSGAVFIVEAKFGPNGPRALIPVERRRDRTWTVYSRAYGPADARIGAGRRRVGGCGGGREDVPLVVESTGDRERVSIAQAAARRLVHS